jgi:hypothetical protein
MPVMGTRYIDFDVFEKTKGIKWLYVHKKNFITEDYPFAVVLFGPSPPLRQLESDKTTAKIALASS